MKISLVTISYNQARFLGDLFGSVRSQLGPEDEHIIVDAGSTDCSRQLIADYAFKRSSISTIFEKDEGPGDGLNKGFAAASGEIFAYINADDFLLPGALDFVRGYFSRNARLDVLLGSIKIADSRGVIAARGRVPDRPSAKRLATGVWQYYQQGTFFRSRGFKRINGFNASNRTCWDRELIADMALAGLHFKVSSRPLGAFRIYDESITGSGGQHSEKYRMDCARINRNAKTSVGARSNLVRALFLMEQRLNPLRILQQIRPVLVGKDRSNNRFYV
jgi:glycosyltransferase involved in cell wall biosynthesis